MNILFQYSLKLLVPSVILLHLFVSPYTKVEESFNLQAIHDILEYGIPFKTPAETLKASYDHVEFPGSVPRTFVGAVLLSELARPLKFLVSEPVHMQLLVRGVLGLINSTAILSFEQAVRQAFGVTAGNWYLVLQASQFHAMYYASRTLPNMFAFAMTTFALRFFLLSGFGNRKKRTERSRRVIVLLTAAGVIFRAEIALLVLMFSVSFFINQKNSLKTIIIPAGLASATVALIATVSMDSFFWQKFPLWPEFVAFRYNTLEGKSSEWGTSPWHYYFTNSIPKLMMNPMLLIICVPIAISVRSTRRFSLETLSPLVSYVALYSILPHKEWRFILYISPGLTAVSAAGAAWIWTRRAKSFLYVGLRVALALSVLSSFVGSLGLSAISSLNYPGSQALNQLHYLASSKNGTIRVHLDNLSCQTGITRFLQQPAPSISDGSRTGPLWIYDKTEDETLLRDPSFWTKFDYAISETPAPAGEWDIVDTVRAYDGIDFNTGDDMLSLLVEEPFHRLGFDVSRFVVYGQSLKDWVKIYVTVGRWPGIRMKPKLHILERQETGNINYT